MDEIHIWIGNKSGIWRTPVGRNPTFKGEKLIYMGFTTTTGFPIILNNGRVIRKPTSKAFKKSEKFRSRFKRMANN